MTPTIPAEEFRRLVDQLEGAKTCADWGAEIDAIRNLERFLLSHAPALLALVEGEGWQDISTLPLKEGAQIIKGGNIPYSAVDGLLADDRDGVMVTVPMQRGTRIWPTMKKWRPLPPPPKDIQDER